jgi:hypothetical protein
LRPAALRRLGWHYVRVHTFELFADPEAVAARIAGIAGLSSAVTMEVETLDAASPGDASIGLVQGPVETHAPLSATEAIDAAIEKERQEGKAEALKTVRALVAEYGFTATQLKGVLKTRGRPGVSTQRRKSKQPLKT